MKKDKCPLVSIIIPVYNGANYLAQAIDSALSQTYHNVEVIVVNDGSTDNGATEQVALSYKEKIKYYPKENGGVSSALNFGIDKMSGDYFSWLSHDDLYKPEKIELSLQAIENEPDGTIAICGTSFIDANGKPFTMFSRNVQEGKCYSGLELFKYCYLNQVALNGCSLLIPKSAIDKCGKFSSLKFAQDMEYWARLMIQGYSFKVFRIPLSITRIHRQQVTARCQDIAKKEKSTYIQSIATYCNNVANGNQYKRILLCYCYSLVPQQKECIQAISQSVSLPVLYKYYYLIKGSILYTLKYLFRKIKYLIAH